MGDAQTDYLVEDEEVNGPAETFGQVVRATDLQRIERRNRILALRRDGFTYDAISLTLAQGGDGKEPFEITPSGVGAAIRSYVADLAGEDRESATELRAIDNERLERMFKRLELDARSTDPKTREKAIAQQLRILERHAKLNGLDAPTVHRHEGTVAVETLANPDHVAKVDAEFKERFGKADFELPPGDVEDLPDAA